VILLDMPLSLSKALLAERTGKTGGNTGDIHEQDASHLTAVHDAYDMLVNTYDWHRVHCENESNQLRTIDDIHEEVYGIAKQYICKG
ncbi:MAG: thymidylate kinase, partial [Veillonella sp.]